MKMKVEGIILAAGLSSRANTFKLTLDFHGKTIIERCLEGMYSFCSQIYVVVGHKYELLESKIKNYPKVKIIINEKYEDGMFSSIKAGLSCIKGERFFLIPADYPKVCRETYRKLLNSKGDIILPTYDGKKGHPIIMRSSVIEEIFADNDCNNLREFIYKYGFSTLEVGDKGILMDVDTLDDYKRLLLSK